MKHRHRAPGSGAHRAVPHRHRATRALAPPRALTVGLLALTPLILVGSVEHPRFGSPSEPAPAAVAAEPPVPELGYVLGAAATPANTPAVRAARSASGHPTVTAPSASGTVGSGQSSSVAPSRPPPSEALVISTTYTSGNPFSLGDLLLNSHGDGLVGSGCFGCAGNGITITDTRLNDHGWTASAQTSDFTHSGRGPEIDGDALVLHDIAATYTDGEPAGEAAVRTQSIDHFKSSRKSFASARAGSGTVSLRGEFALTAPTSTPPGAYTATITFTVV